MPRLTSFIVFRSWASNPLRTALSLLGIGFGTAIVVAIYVMDHNTIRSRMIAQDPMRGAVDLEVAPLQAARDAATVLQDLAGRPGVQGAAVWREGRVLGERQGQRLDLAAFGLSPLPAQAFGHYRVAEGRDLRAGDGDAAVLLGQEAARLLQVRPGDRLDLVEPMGAQRVLCQDGVLQVLAPEPGRAPARAVVQVVGILGHDLLGRRNFGQVVVGSHALVRGLAPAGQDLFHVVRTYGADLDRLRTSLQADYRAVDLRAAMLGEGADERAFRNGLKVLGCLALVLGMFVVFQTLSHSLVSRVRQLGLLRCLGVSPGAVLRIFLGDAVALGVLGSLLGIGLGLLLALLLREQRVSSLGVGKEWLTFEVPLVPVLWTGVLGVVFTLAGAAFPLWRARRLSPLSVLHGRGLGDRQGRDLLQGVNLWLLLLLVLVLPLAYLAMTPLVSEEGYETLVVVLELVGMLLLFGAVLLLAPMMVAVLGRVLLWPVRLLLPLPAWLVAVELRRGRGRVAASVCGLGAVLVALLGLQGITAGLRAEVREFGYEALEERLFLEGPAVTPAVALTLGAVPGVDRVEPEEGQVAQGFLLSGLAPELAAAAGSALEADPAALRRYADPARRTLIASHRLAAKMGWRNGSLVSLHDRNRNPVAYEVVMVSDRSGYQPSERAWAVTAPHWLRRDFCVPEACVERVTLRLQPSADPDVVLERVRQLLPGILKARTGVWIRDYHLRDVTRDFRLFELLLLLILLLAGVGLLNGMTIAALGRTRELGVLRALGMGPRALLWSFVLEGAVVAVLAALLALAICVPMVQVLLAGLNRVAGLRAPVALPWEWMVLAPGLALVVGVLAALLPGLRMRRQDPAAAVRYE